MKTETPKCSQMLGLVQKMILTDFDESQKEKFGHAYLTHCLLLLSHCNCFSERATSLEDPQSEHSLNERGNPEADTGPAQNLGSRCAPPNCGFGK